MPLDPLVKAFLDRAAAIPRPKAWDVPPAITRQSFAAMMQLTSPKDVAVGKVENFAIPGPGGEIRARSYAPVAAAGPLPTLIYFHGGGFVAGNLESHDGLCRLFAAEGGFKVIAVGGDSAGGMLAAIVTQLAREKGGIKIAYQLLLFPNTQMGAETASLNEFAVGYFLERRAIEYFNSLYLTPEADTNSPNVSPLRAKEFAGLPGAYVMLGGYDPLHDEGLAYAEKLRAAGVKVTIADYAEMVHCFIYLQTILPQAHEAAAQAAHAVKAALDAA
jgi:acetyl esterase